MWNEVFANWRDSEGSNPVWQDFAKDVKGWNSWEERRLHQSNQMGADKRSWQLYEIVGPNELVPKFKIGPFASWQNNFKIKNKHTFQYLVQNHFNWVTANTGVNSIRLNFPQKTMFIGIYLPEDDSITMFDGTHRATAVALAKYQNDSIEFDLNPLIAITILDNEDRQLFNNMLRIGSGNNK
ncbi:hypothetical protein KJ641_01040 [Patescibacteria group bacterium]|nr:hypothetical protein [Patescibacteria group bacterium]MBU1895442.1 hypothetical protein [Patescibacteria group bacterium]